MKVSRNVQFPAILSLLFLCISTVPVEAGEKLQPKEIIKVWNDALSDGNISVAEKYTSITASKYIENNWGSLEGLSQIYQKSKIKQIRTMVNKQEIDGDVSIVEYTVFYPDNSIKGWRDTLFLEHGVWKVAPQFARSFKK